MTALLFTTEPADEPSTRFNSAAVEVTPFKMLSSAAVEVTRVSDPDVPMCSAAVRSSDVDLFASQLVLNLLLLFHEHGLIN